MRNGRVVGGRNGIIQEKLHNGRADPLNLLLYIITNILMYFIDAFFYYFVHQIFCNLGINDFLLLMSCLIQSTSAWKLDS